MQKLFRIKWIDFFIITVLVIGLISEISVPFCYDSGVLFWPLRIIRSFLNPLHLGFYNSGFFFYKTFGTSNYCNYINLGMYYVLLYGYIIFIRSGRTEDRILKVFLSVILLSTLLSVIVKILELSPLLNYTFIPRNWAISLAIKLSWLLASYYTFKKSLHVSNAPSELFPSIKSTRIIHYFIDAVLIIIIFSPYTILLKEYPIALSVNYVGYLGYYLMLKIIFGLFYYFFFEFLFQTTPGKIITNSFVLSTNNQTISIGKSIGRSVLRLIPLEELSLLGKNVWHDKFSDTKVVSYKKDTCRRIYWPILISTLVIFFTIIITIFNHFARENKKLKFQTKLNFHRNILRSDILGIKNGSYIVINNCSTSELAVFSVDSIYANTLYGNLLADKKHTTIPNIIKKNNVLKTNAKISFSDLKDLSSIVETNDSAYFKPLKLFNTDTAFNLKYILNNEAPIIELNNIGHFGNQFTIGFDNYGFESNLIEINNISSNINWKEELPKLINENNNSKENAFKITGHFYDLDKDYSFSMTFLNAKNDTFKYIIRGRSFNMHVAKKIN